MKSWIEEFQDEVDEMAEMMVSKGSPVAALGIAETIRAECPDDEEGAFKSLFFGLVADAIRARFLH